MSLSDKIVKVYECRKCLDEEVCFKKDVKEFIKELKEEINQELQLMQWQRELLIRDLNELAGEKLI